MVVLCITADNADASPFGGYDDMYRIKKLGTVVYGNVRIGVTMIMQMEKIGIMSKSPGYRCIVSYAYSHSVSYLSLFL